MARTCTEDESSLLISHRIQDDDGGEDDGEEEALSLCDLPVNLPSENVEFRSIAKEEKEFDSGFEFGIGSSFGAWSAACEPAPEMSTADELFFKGRMLPLRHSLSLNAGNPGSTRLITRSETVGFRRTVIRSDLKIKNSFIDYSQPSPQPQIRRSSSMTARVNSTRNPKSIWDFLRLGLVRTPEIELRTASNAAGNAKLSVSRNSSCSSTSTSSDSKKTGSGESRTRNRRSFLFAADCKCSVLTETMAPVKIKVSSGETEDKQRLMEEKTAKKEKKTTMARNRTFEWLKELSQVGLVVDHGRTSLA